MYACTSIIMYMYIAFVLLLLILLTSYLHEWPGGLCACSYIRMYKLYGIYAMMNLSSLGVFHSVTSRSGDNRQPAGLSFHQT